ncbi:hypothetical protein AC529_01895 [Thermobifida cellulosilytica TB100]|uniref:Peptidase S8/S53 domain-containing protein n=1 Tax=Thermobifida cellulosilytica TB100 TaxID=665004 RepID=A0A147KM63_THECS|nr:hypothetical protein AC529_01895 [Thermobifida cellulosilytica TB100]
MTENPSGGSRWSGLPHLVVPGTGQDRAYKPGGGGRPPAIRPITDRRGHARSLRTQLTRVQEEVQERKASVPTEIQDKGITVSVVGCSGYQFSLGGLDSTRADGGRLLVEHPQTKDAPQRAVVWLPPKAQEDFLKRLDEFATEDRPNGKPRHAETVAHIQQLMTAALRDFWVEEAEFPDEDVPLWWEVWLLRRSPKHQPLKSLRIAAQRYGWTVSGALTIHDHVIVNVYASARDLAPIVATDASLAELHRPSEIHELAGADTDLRRELVYDLARRLTPPDRRAPAVCLLDTGILGEHPLLRPFLAHPPLTALPDTTPADGGNYHGTRMAGLALFGDSLDKALVGSEAPLIRTLLESVKIVDARRATELPLYGEVTAAGTALAEAADPERRRAFSLPITDFKSPATQGLPTAWSASLDALAFGTDVARSDNGIELLGDPDPEAARLYVVSAGNVDNNRYSRNHGFSGDDYLDVNVTSVIEAPAQAWNVLTVGAYTELMGDPSVPELQGYTPLAPRGELSPWSRTAVEFRKPWPNKPDIVLEGGNLLRDKNFTHAVDHESVSLVTTGPPPDLLHTANATSAATAQAARLCALVWERYPKLWPETVRGLLVHAAEWTEPMQAKFNGAKRKTDRKQLLRQYGWGVPREKAVLNSFRNTVTMLIEDEFHPFEKSKSGRFSIRKFRLHELPWPAEVFRQLWDVQCHMKVTLSYFVEPNPSRRGWRGRYSYASHQLRFAVKKPEESDEDFVKRIGREASDEENSRSKKSQGEDKNWFIGPESRNKGSVSCDIWSGTGAQLAESGLIGVVPVNGWWKETKLGDRRERAVRYSLLVSLSAPDVDVDIYTPITNQISVQTPVENRV